MKIRLFRLIALVAFYFAMTPAFAVNLLQAYQHALVNDPSFKNAKAQWLAERENIAISRAALLPSLDVTAAVTRNHYSAVQFGSIIGEGQSNYSTEQNYQLNLTQPIFNAKSWSALKAANATTKAATAQYYVAAQDLILRLANQYFTVLKAADNVRFIRAEKASLARQLSQTKQRYKVGMVTITDVHQAQAAYDGILAQEIAGENELTNQKENLQQITNYYYDSFSGLKANLPLIAPIPANIEQWVAAARQQNYMLKAALYNVQAAKAAIGIQKAGHLPEIDVIGSLNYHEYAGSGEELFPGGRTTKVELSVNWPIFQGGMVNAQTRQYRYKYQQVLADWEKTNREVVSNTRQAYLGILSAISQIKADKKAIISYQSALKATQAGYKVGTSTIADVLKVQADLYAAEKTYSANQYDYLLAMLQLKQATGALSGNSLQAINGWLR